MPDRDHDQAMADVFKAAPTHSSPLAYSRSLKREKPMLVSTVVNASVQV